MGMFDTIECHLMLPGKTPAWWAPGHAFQTKSLDCELAHYVISNDSRFSHALFTGVIEFYGSNIVGSGPGLYTAKGEDAETVSYEAKIVDGTVVSLTQTEYSIKPALPSAAQIDTFRPPKQEEIAAWKAREQRPLVGERLYVLWGGQETGYWVKVLAQNERQLCTEHEADSRYHHKGEMELLLTWDLDRIIWDSEEAALAEQRRKRAEWDRRRAEYDAYAKAWATKRNG